MASIIAVALPLRPKCDRRGSAPSLALPQPLERLGHAPLARLVAFGLVDPAGVLLAVGVGQPFERGACPGVLGRALASASGTSTSRGAVSSSSSTSTVSL